eukprot:2695800-Amphidinium_carterae.1
MLRTSISLDGHVCCQVQIWSEALDAGRVAFTPDCGAATADEGVRLKEVTSALMEELEATYMMCRK